MHSYAQWQTRRAFFERLAAVLPSRTARLAFFLFAILQVVAPMWHVCEMSGRCGDCKPQANGALLCHTTPEAKSAPEPASDSVAAKPRCEHCKPAPIAAGTPVLESDSRPKGFKGTCLARELRTMPFAAMAKLCLDIRVVRVRQAAPQKITVPSLESAPLPPARGPPVSL